MWKSYSLILIVILIWLSQNSFNVIYSGRCCQQRDIICNCSKEYITTCNKISEGYCDVTCAKEFPITTSFDENNISRTFRNAHVDNVGTIPSFNSSFLVTSNDCLEYMDFIVQLYLYLGQSHYRSPPLI